MLESPRPELTGRRHAPLSGRQHFLRADASSACWTHIYALRVPRGGPVNGGDRAALLLRERGGQVTPDGGNRGAWRWPRLRAEDVGWAQIRTWARRLRRRETLDDATLLEEDTTRQGTQEASGSRKRRGKGFSPGVSRREHSPARTLISAQRDPWWTPTHQDRERINRCCAKPLGGWRFGT